MKNGIMGLKVLYPVNAVLMVILTYFRPQMRQDFMEMDTAAKVMMIFVALGYLFIFTPLLNMFVMLFFAVPTHHAVDLTMKKVMKDKGESPASIEETFVQMTDDIIDFWIR